MWRLIVAVLALSAALAVPSTSNAALQEVSIGIYYDVPFARWRFTVATAAALGLQTSSYPQPEGLGVAKAFGRLDTSVSEYTCTALLDLGLRIIGENHYVPVFKLKKCAPAAP